MDLWNRSLVNLAPYHMQDHPKNTASPCHGVVPYALWGLGSACPAASCSEQLPSIISFPSDHLVGSHQSRQHPWCHHFTTAAHSKVHDIISS